MLWSGRIIVWIGGYFVLLSGAKGAYTGNEASVFPLTGLINEGVVWIYTHAPLAAALWRTLPAFPFKTKPDAVGFVLLLAVLFVGAWVRWRGTALLHELADSRLRVTRERLDEENRR